MGGDSERGGRQKLRWSEVDTSYIYDVCTIVLLRDSAYFSVVGGASRATMIYLYKQYIPIQQ
jgi:hypothetical protein